jgi:hypothetical protein
MERCIFAQTMNFSTFLHELEAEFQRELIIASDPLGHWGNPFNCS